ncbi:hypothetical protein [Rhodococcus qingshengii]|uniref:hypothetical protein n=1 Tax=Rhodococcus qingshengii TaxID=334542 RepID=UPI001BEBBA69|nr:hypothetical protein [Rhodococcus qingshengii]MBT2273568.1 hypothetical protein [Rhodococcus qingshengii]
MRRGVEQRWPAFAANVSGMGWRAILLHQCSQQTNVNLCDTAEGLIARVAADFDVPSALRTRFDHLLLHIPCPQAATR